MGKKLLLNGLKLRASGALLIFIATLFSFTDCSRKSSDADATIDKRVDSVLALMTLDEKIGQMNQLDYKNDILDANGEVNSNSEVVKMIRAGKIGSILNIFGAEVTRKVQEIAIKESRLKIPLIFGMDVIHGCKTIFPVPLAEASSWDMEAITKSDSIAASEATALGIHWTFAPMVDICRDPRWGRVTETAGEDPFLGSKFAAAKVKGFQGNDYSKPDRLAACVKHYAAYGAAEGGRDYNTTDMSERLLREIYLPNYKAAIDAGCATLMSSFNEFNGTPSTGNYLLQNKILRQEWGFKGYIVSDWNAINEIINHRAASNKSEAARLALDATVDMDMEGKIYIDTLKQLVKKGEIKEKQIDDAVRRILRVKFKAGLFADPYKCCNKEREKKQVMTNDNLKLAFDLATKSVVMLKNKNNILPLNNAPKTIAVIGPLADSRKDMLGAWSNLGEVDKCISILDGIRKRASGPCKIIYAKGCGIDSYKTDSILSAVNIAKKADMVILCLGESRTMSGEAASRTNIGLPGVQLNLAIEIIKTGKPVIVTLSNGRPLDIKWLSENADAILETWFLGTTAGDAIAGILFGEHNPSGKLTVSFPQNTGQIPVYYNYKTTGRPPIKNQSYRSQYLDCPNEPLFPFGYGLSYTTFDYSDMKLTKDTISKDGKITLTVTVRNSGHFDGAEIVQMYIQDRFAYGISRPVKELKGFVRITLKKNESKVVTFEILPEMLEYYDKDMKKIIEPGEFIAMAGKSSDDKDLLKKSFWVK